MYDFYKGLVDIILYILLGHNKGKLCRYFHHKILGKLYVDLCFDMFLTVYCTRVVERNSK